MQVEFLWFAGVILMIFPRNALIFFLLVALAALSFFLIERHTHHMKKRVETCDWEITVSRDQARRQLFTVHSLGSETQSSQLSLPHFTCELKTRDKELTFLADYLFIECREHEEPGKSYTISFNSTDSNWFKLSIEGVEPYYLFPACKES